LIYSKTSVSRTLQGPTPEFDPAGVFESAEVAAGGPGMGPGRGPGRWEGAREGAWEAGGGQGGGLAGLIT